MGVSPDWVDSIDLNGAEETVVVAADPIEHRPDDPFQRGDRIGRYVIVGKLGKGGMGVVYSAYDPDLNRRVAIKVLRDPVGLHHDGSEGKQTMLLREAQAMAQLSHPNVLPVYDVGTVRDRVFIATEYVEGRTLNDWTGEKPHSWREVIRVFEAAGQGLAAAHRAGLIHRDFKPQNVMIDGNGSIRVMDFGLARLSPGVDESKSHRFAAHDPQLSTQRDADPSGQGLLGESMTVAGTVMGTPAYMAPEQHAGVAVGPAGDQYAFCVALWETLYGVRPFARSDGVSLAQAKRAMTLQPIHERKVPRWLKRVLLRGLAPDPEDRWPSLDALLRALQQDPARRLLRIGAVTTVVAVTVSSSLLAYHSAQGPAPCGGGQEQVQAVWSPPIRDQLRASLLTTGRPYASDIAEELSTLVDGYVDEWLTTRANTCRATTVHREQSETVMDQKMNCLDDSLDQVSVYLQVLTELPSVTALDRATSEFKNMASLELCKDVDALARRDKIPIPAVEQPAIEALGGETRRLKALMAAAPHDKVDAQVERIEQLLGKVSHPPTRARTLWPVVQAHQERGRKDERDRILAEVRDLASQYDDRWLLGLVWSLRLWVVGMEEKRLDAARELIPVAESAVTLARDEPDAGRARLTLDNIIAAIERSAGNLAGAEQRYMDIIAQDADLVTPYNNLSIVLIYRGKLEEAREALAKAEVPLEGSGELNPYYPTIFVNRGLSYHWQGELDLAEQWYRKALDRGRRSFGEDNWKTSFYRLYLGQVLTDLGEWPAANRELELAATGFAKAFGPKFELAIHARVQQARIALDRGEVASARVQIDAARADLESSEIEQISAGYMHPLYVDGLVAVAEGDWNRASESFTRALDVYRKLYEAGSLEFVRPLIGLAEVHLASGQTARAQEAVGEALDLLRAGNSSMHDLRLAQALEVQVRLNTLASDYEGAEVQARRALAIWEHTAPTHPRALEVRKLVEGRGNAPP